MVVAWVLVVTCCVFVCVGVGWMWSGGASPGVCMGFVCVVDDFDGYLVSLSWCLYSVCCCSGVVGLFKEV